MTSLDGHDDTIMRNLDAKKRISPAGLANVLMCPKADAKLILQRFSRRGYLRPLANGWFEAMNWNPSQPSAFGK